MNDLIIWTIYDHPSDYPDKFVARKHTAKLGATDELLFADDLDSIREAVQAASPYVLGMMQRHPSDDPIIVECWL